MPGPLLARLLWLCVILLGCGGSAEAPLAATGTRAPQTPPQTLAAGLEQRHAPTDGEDLRSFQAALQVGDYLQLSVEQLGVDVLLRLLSPAGELLLEVDSPIGRQGTERLYFAAAEAGAHILQVEPFAAPQAGGSFVLRVEALRPAGPRDRLRAVAAAAEQAAAGPAKSLARISLERALELWREAEEAAAAAKVESQLAALDREAGQTEAAEVGYRSAAAAFAAADEPLHQATTLLSLGSMFYRLGRVSEAIEVFRQGLAPAAASVGRQVEADLLYNLATCHMARGELQPALDFHEREATLRGEGETSAERAGRLYNLGVLNRQLGRWQRAVDLLSEAARLFDQLGDARGWSNSLAQLGEAQRGNGQPSAAAVSFRQALANQRQRRASRELATTLVAFGLLLKQDGRLDEAREFYEEALTHQDVLDRTEIAITLANLAAIDRAEGRPDQALERSASSLELHRQGSNPVLEAYGLTGVAAAQRQLGLLEESRQHYEEALELFESTRYSVLSSSRRATYLATAQPHYSSYVDLLVELGEPAEALAAVERSRARSLLDSLGLASIALGDNPELFEAERQARRRVESLAARRQALWQLPGGDSAGLSQVEVELRKALDRLESIVERRRLASAGYRDLTRPEPLGLKAIQDLLDPDTQLLEIHLGERRSFLWLLSMDRFELFELPAAAELEGLAQAAYRALGRSHRREARAQVESSLCALSQQLLWPIAEQLKGSRLVVVADGALRYLPLAVLPDPRFSDPRGGCEGAPPLLEQHEIISLPSASVLASLRRPHRPASQPPSPSEAKIVVVADPVVSAADSRLAVLGPSSDGGSPRASFGRLDFSRREAEAIVALSPPESVWPAVGFEAAKSAVGDTRLASADIVHFAVHGVLDDEHPELSGLVLSSFAADGSPREGFLGVHEIYNLRLQADLVVLSACSTALGREIRGEGLVGLTRGFMFAGARQVLVSLWNVDDKATAELMERFYRALLQDGLRPAAALRRAQLELRRQPGREPPFYWAGFELQGDWR